MGEKAPCEQYAAGVRRDRPDLRADDPSVPHYIDWNRPALCHVEEAAVEPCGHHGTALGKHLRGLRRVVPPKDIVADRLELAKGEPQSPVGAEQAIDLLGRHALGKP